jgi:hypothetical protein
MTVRVNMTPTSRRFAKALVRKFPRFAKQLRVLPSGDFEAAIVAPRNSKAGALVCQSHSEDVWIRIGVPRAVYLVASPRELISIIEAVLSDEAQFVLLSKKRTWSGTTLVRRGSRPAQQSGESARIVSWSGRFDRRLRAPKQDSRARPA